MAWLRVRAGLVRVGGEGVGSGAAWRKTIGFELLEMGISEPAQGASDPVAAKAAPSFAGEP